MLDRTHRIEELAGLIAAMLGFDIAKARRAGLLAKGDLVTGIVGEFPELQGTIGRLLALDDGEDAAVANAIGEQYQPAGPDDRVPDEPISIAVALADKIDSLVTLWRAGEKPSGSRDPFALRRAGLGILRLVLQNSLRLPLLVPLAAVVILHRGEHALHSSKSLLAQIGAGDNAVLLEILAFLADRLKFALRDEGVRHDLIDAVFVLSGDDDFVRLVGRVKALEAVLKTEDGANLLTAYRRAANILRIEEKRDSRSYERTPNADRLELPEEKELLRAMTAARERIAAKIADECYGDAMSVMAGLRAPVDRFFDKVTVNTPEAMLRENRLFLLSALRQVLHTIADFSRIEG
jgi:glycyl-tRNA synthetase beta chain